MVKERGSMLGESPYILSLTAASATVAAVVTCNYRKRCAAGLKTSGNE